MSEMTITEIHEKHRRERIHARAEILCAMDCLMHHLNNEDAFEPWAALAVPDGMPWDILTPNAERETEYSELAEDMSDEEFEQFVQLFARTVRRECFRTVFQKCSFC